MVSYKEGMEKSWHRVSREGAERLLAKAEEGTYLVRHDELIDRVKRVWRRQLHTKEVNYFVVTVVGPERKIFERLIVKTPEGWRLYDDDPSLQRGLAAPKLSDLLEALVPEAKFPLRAA